MKGHLALATLLALGGDAAAAPLKSPWSENDSGRERARLIIDQCLSRAEAKRPDNSEPCINVVYQACEAEHGTSQHDMNACAYFSRSAWEERLAAARSRLLSAKTVDPKFGTAEPMVERLRESERRWDEWNRTDCALQSALSEGGSMHSMELDICLSAHAAHRARELEALAFWWAKAFSLPDVVPK